MKITLYTRKGCHLCDDVRAQLESMQSRYPHRLVEVDIDSDDALTRLYMERIPVVRIGPYTLEAPIERSALEVTLAAAARSDAPAPARTAGERKQLVRINRIVLFFARHWLAMVNLIVAFYLGMSFAAPALMKAGHDRAARWVYAAYSPMCHQLAFRSFFLFGEQAAYPRTVAGLSTETYGQATGLSEDDFVSARRFLGNEDVGYKTALCERDVAIYGGILLAGLAFSLVRKWLPPVPMALWIVLGIVPIALDGGSQLLANIPFLPFAVRESTPALRVATGLLFGVMNAWLAFPYTEETMNDARAMIAARLAGASEAAQD
jgi:uncharacterized membrane protein